jgi:hypothetical protein
MDEKGNPNEKELALLIANRDGAWAEIRQRQSEIIEIIDSGYIEDKKSNGIILNCLNLVIGDFVIYESKYSKNPDKKMEKLFKSKISDFSYYSKMIKLIVGLMDTIDNAKLDTEERLNAVEQIRRQTWYNIYAYFMDIIEMIMGIQEISSKQKQLIINCLRTVITELNLQEIEISLIDGSYDEKRDNKGKGMIWGSRENK